jgi:hypothetical protein
VLKNPIQMSQTQIDQFKKHYPGTARPLQPLNGRPVSETKFGHGDIQRIGGIYMQRRVLQSIGRHEAIKLPPERIGSGLIRELNAEHRVLAEQRWRLMDYASGREPLTSIRDGSDRCGIGLPKHGWECARVSKIAAHKTHKHVFGLILMFMHSSPRFA